MKTYKVKDQEEAVKNAKLFYETVKFAWGHHITYCYHDLIHMIKNDLCYDLYVVPQRSWGDRSDTDHSKCLLLGGRRLNLLTIIPKPKGSGGARAATAQIGPANERNKTK